MTINLADNSPRVSYAVAAGVTQSSFTVSFEFFEEADLNVYVDGTLKTLTTDYTVSGGDGSTGSVAISVTGASGGSTVVITRSIALERTTDFPSSGPFDIASLNTELDKVIGIAADLDDEATRGLRLKDQDEAVSTELPLKADRLGKVLAFNATTGVPEAGPTIADTQALADITADIGTLADIEDGTDATDAIQTVAGISANVTTVAGVSSNVTTVAGISADVTTVAGDATDIATVAGDSADIQTLADISSDITTAAGISANITTVAGDSTDIQALADVTTEIGLLGTADAIADMNTLATSAIVTDMDALADLTTEIDALGDVTADVTTVAGISSNVTTVAGVSANVTTVAGVASDVTTVAGISANTTTVAGISSNVTTVAGISSDVTTAATNNANITTVAGSISNVNSVGGSIANVNTVATNLSGVNSFAERYRVGTTDPTTSLDEGDLFYNTTDNGYKFYDGSAWQTVNVSGIGNVVEDTTPQLGGTLDANSNIIDMGTNTITDTKVGQWDTAYGWGDHSTQSYLTANQTITLSGDVSGSGTTAITVTVADDSHNHIISNVDGLQTALDAKLPLAGGTMTGNLDIGSNNIGIGGSGKWTVEFDSGDNDLLFKYNGTTVLKFASTGEITSAADIIADGTP
jgi:hypothetical protein